MFNMEPLHREREAPTCRRCGGNIDTKNRDIYTCRKVGLTPGEYIYLHWSCVTPAEAQRFLEELR